MNLSVHEERETTLYPTLVCWGMVKYSDDPNADGREAIKMEPGTITGHTLAEIRDWLGFGSYSIGLVATMHQKPYLHQPDNYVIAPGDRIEFTRVPRSLFTDADYDLLAEGLVAINNPGSVAARLNLAQRLVTIRRAQQKP